MKRGAKDKTGGSGDAKRRAARVIMKVNIALAILEIFYFANIIFDIPVLSQARDIWIETAMTTADHQWLATRFFPSALVDRVMSRQVVTAEGTISDPSLVTRRWGAEGQASAGTGTGAGTGAGEGSSFGVGSASGVGAGVNGEAARNPWTADGGETAGTAMGSAAMSERNTPFSEGGAPQGRGLDGSLPEGGAPQGLGGPAEAGSLNGLQGDIYGNGSGVGGGGANGSSANGSSANGSSANGSANGSGGGAEGSSIGSEALGYGGAGFAGGGQGLGDGQQPDDRRRPRASDAPWLGGSMPWPTAGSKDEHGNTVVVRDEAEGIAIIEVRAPNYIGRLLYVADPSRVVVGHTRRKGVHGELIKDYMEEYGAIAGINGNGFLDPDGHGKGGDIIGWSVSGGEEWGAGRKGQYASVGMNEDDVLVVGIIDDFGAHRIRDLAQYGPTLIADGKTLVSGSAGWGLQPRSAIGQREDGSVILATFDGRQPGHSIGITAGEVAQILSSYGCVNAGLCDGGSSSVMMYDGKVLGRPSTPMRDTGRYLPNAFLVLKNETKAAIDSDRIYRINPTIMKSLS